jgi:hypothetical protein
MLSIKFVFGRAQRWKGAKAVPLGNRFKEEREPLRMKGNFAFSLKVRSIQKKALLYAETDNGSAP